MRFLCDEGHRHTTEALRDDCQSQGAYWDDYFAFIRAQMSGQLPRRSGVQVYVYDPNWRLREVHTK